MSSAHRDIDVSIVMPCLDEAQCLPACMTNAQAALALFEGKLGLKGEIVVADNGSQDGSREIAAERGARVVCVARRGYGAALIGGARAARGRYIVMGDCDGSYDFRESLPMVEALRAGADLCMGSRFKGSIAPGAMPWKNRWIGNPLLTGALNLLFRSGVSDAHCGLRALTKRCFETIGLEGSGMEFASEMVIKATLKGFRIAETPVALAHDLRDRAPHLRPWRDGWRHLRYLLMLSPAGLFGAPAALVGLCSLGLLLYAAALAATGRAGDSVVGNYWVILAGAMLGVSHVAGLLSAATHLYGARAGYRRRGRLSERLARFVSLETMLLSGAACVALGLAVLVAVVVVWSRTRYGAFGDMLPAVVGTTLIVIGAQNALGGFLLAILNGHEAEFLKVQNAEPQHTPIPARRRAA